MRILALNYEFPPLGGGASNATAHICRELVQMGNEVEVLTSGFPGLPGEEEHWGYQVHRVPVVRKKIHQSSPHEMSTFAVSALLPALSLIRRFRPHIVHAYFAIPTGVVAWLLHAFTRTPYILSLRGGDVPGFLPDALGNFHRLTAPLTSVIWDNAAAIVANSEGLQQLAQRTANIPVALATNGIDLETYSPPTQPRSDGVFRILFVGRLVEQKGLRYLIETLPAVQAKSPSPVELLVVGDGPAMPALQQQATDLGLSNAVRFAGWQQRAAMPGLYQSADVFAFPSFEEGMPNVVLEAMASGLPIVTTDIYGNRELVTDGDNGYLTPPADTLALQHALTTLAQDVALRSRMGARAQLRTEDYGWQRTARIYAELSRQALLKQPSPDRVPANVR